MNKITNALNNAIYVIFTALMAVILVLDLFFQYKDYFYKRIFILPNLVYLLLFMAMTLFVSFFIPHLVEKYNITCDRTFKTINILSIALFIFLVYISYNVYFMTGWDAGRVINDAKAIAGGEIIDGTYYSQYPNQQFLLILESFLFKISNCIGLTDISKGLMVLIVFQCILFTLTGNVLYRIIYEKTGSVKYSFMGWIIFCWLLAFSGWVSVPYSDGMTILLPILILRLYQLKEKKEGKIRLLYWAGIALLSYWGYRLKPTVLIALVAIIIVEAVSGKVRINKEVLKKTGSVAAVLVICVVISQGLFRTMIGSTGITINSELNTGPLHMIMMGLNDERDGAWYADDVALSTGISDKDERIEAQLAVIKERLEEYGFIGLAKHTAKKSLLTFNDGTFAWAVEGGFFEEIYEIKDAVICPFIRSHFYGFFSIILSDQEQGFWILTLFLSGFAWLLKKDKFTGVTVLSLVGIILFNYLFEPRARYVMIYVPAFIVLAMLNLQVISDRLLLMRANYIKAAR